ncbi:chemokine-like receptor 1 [Rana temporaria]|uniref:chemokine-like receptor 1 n=1 Tax=Rana temporaria TaxID=8407 RepID=UPI001AAC8C7A|nr:chemokine-like receptor 1 [Rana temporaria]
MAYPITNVTLLTGTIITSITNSVNGTEKGVQRIQPIVQEISIVAYIVAFLLGTTGNGLVIFFTTFRMKKTVSVVWFLNLAIADFSFTFLLILRIVRLAMDHHWPFGRFMCILNSAIFYINQIASLFLITVISIDRLVSVKFPVWCQNHRTPRLASIVTLVVWVLAFILSLPYSMFKDTTKVENVVYCLSNYFSDKDVARNYGVTITRFVGGFVLPLTVIVLCYTVILSHIRRKYMTKARKPLKIIAAVIISFFVCWFPYHVFSLLRLSIKYRGKEHFKNVVRIGMQYCKILAIMHSCVNPVLYVFVGRDFKEKFRSSILSIFEHSFLEETVQTISKRLDQVNL